MISEISGTGRLRRVFEKFDLTDRGYAMARIVERVFGKTGAMQQWLGGYVAFVESRNRALGGEPCYCGRLLGRALGHVNAPYQGFAQPGLCWLGKPFLLSGSGWRTARPTLEGMIERGRTLVADEPRDLRQCKAWLFEILEREATAQLVNDLREGRAFTQ